MVRARSAAEMPVLMPSRASTDTEYAVCLRSSFTYVIGGSFSRSSSGPSIGTHTTPDVCRTMNASSSGVTFDAATTRSPSFSRSSSSTTTTALPAAMSATARSTVSSRTSSLMPPPPPRCSLDR